MIQTASPLLALNNAHAAELSLLTQERLDALIGMAYRVEVVGEADALMLAFDQDAEYDSPNFLWFCARYPRFAYVDRVVVAPRVRGRGLARRLYAGLSTQAARDGHVLVACEINQVPPNPASDAFHAALGFQTAGVAQVGARVVRYLTRPVPM